MRTNSAIVDDDKLEAWVINGLLIRKCLKRTKNVNFLFIKENWKMTLGRGEEITIVVIVVE